MAYNADRNTDRTGALHRRLDDRTGGRQSVLLKVSA
jgi:hypothetical protein